jgi:hypothetical protein
MSPATANTSTAVTESLNETADKWRGDRDHEADRAADELS